MLKNLLMFSLLSVMAALPAKAQTPGPTVWVGPAGGDIDVAGNWSQDPVLDTFLTWEYRMDAGASVTKTTGYTGYGVGRIKGNNALLTQDDGTMEWLNGTGLTEFGLALFRADVATPATLHMTGGTHVVDRLGLGRDLFSSTPDGFGLVNIWGTGVFQVRQNTFLDPILDPSFDLHINDGSLIDIRGTGMLRVPLSLATKVDGYLGVGKIVAGEVGKSLATASIGSEYVVGIDMPGDFDVDGAVDGDDFLIWQRGDYSPKAIILGDDLAEWEANFGTPGQAVAAAVAAVPEPPSMMLALLSLGLLAGLQRRKNRCS